MPMVKIEMYVTRTCPYCVKAKALLKEKEVAWEEHDISSDPNMMQAMVSRSNGRSTVPQIFIDDRHIGGCDDLYALDARGGLDPLLKGIQA